MADLSSFIYLPIIHIHSPILSLPPFHIQHPIIDSIFYCRHKHHSTMFSSIYPQPTVFSASGSKKDIRFPEDLQVILRTDQRESGNLYLGNVEAAQNHSLIENLKIGAIMCVAKGHVTKHPNQLVKYSKYIPLEDDPNADLSQFLQEGVSFIHQKLSITNVLVHCVAGTNRSACFIMGYLMRHRNLSLEDSFKEVKARRKLVSSNDMQISPSERMLAQLKAFEKRVVGGRIEKSGMTEQLSVDPVGDRTIRLKTNTLNMSNFFGVNDEVSRNNSSKIPNPSVRVEDKEERRSNKSSKSYLSKLTNSHINHINDSKIAYKNPEESFISKNSKPSNILDKSFTSNRPRSLHNVTHFSQINDLPELALEKKASSSRQEFTAKLRDLEVKNNMINQKIAQVHKKFEDQRNSSRLTLEAQLGEINQLRASIYNQRKIRLSRVHDGGVEYVSLLTTQ